MQRASVVCFSNLTWFNWCSMVRLQANVASPDKKSLANTHHNITSFGRCREVMTSRGRPNDVVTMLSVYWAYPNKYFSYFTKKMYAVGTH